MYKIDLLSQWECPECESKSRDRIRWLQENWTELKGHIVDDPIISKIRSEHLDHWRQYKNA